MTWTRDHSSKCPFKFHSRVIKWDLSNCPIRKVSDSWWLKEPWNTSISKTLVTICHLQNTYRLIKHKSFDNIFPKLFLDNILHKIRYSDTRFNQFLQRMWKIITTNESYGTERPGNKFYIIWEVGGHIIIDKNELEG